MYPSKLTTEKVLTSINLVSQDEETNNLVLNSEALNVIRRLNGNVAVCVCVGKHKTGKSFLLNSLFKYFTNVPYNAFEVGHSKNGCTKGCWINKEVPVLKAQKKKDEMNLIFVDTEGVDSEENTDHWDKKLLLFSLLISSLFIYNTTRNLSPNDFKNLASMNQLSTMISLKSGRSKYFNEKFLRNEGPQFVCVVRDFSFKEKLTAKQSLERFLDVEPIQTRAQTTNSKKSKDLLDDKLKRNEIRRNMMNSFRAFDCYRLPEPVSDQTIKGKDKENALETLDSIKYDELREKFRIKFDEMCDDLLKEKLKPKCLHETNLNGFHLAEFMKIIVDLINNEKTVCLYDSLSTAVMREANFRLRKYIDEYQKKMNELPLPVESDELEKFDEEIVKKFLVMLHKSLDSKPMYLDELKSNFYEKRNAKYTEIFKRNREKIFEINKQKVNSLWQNEYKHRMDSAETADEYEETLKNFKIRFKTEEQFEKNKEIPDKFWNDFEKENFIKHSNRIRDNYDESDNEENLVGHYVCHDYGRPVYKHKNGTFYYETKNGKKVFIEEDDVDFD